MVKYILINGIRREMTSEEETKFNKDVEDTKKMRDAKNTEETAAANKKASGKQKLKDLGLDDDEIKALTGA
jgi:hypothetical protein|tara:strand:- start:232 stop:444 length:213 start_codon:yes stop_codon:yes gene_type:complete